MSKKILLLLLIIIVILILSFVGFYWYQLSKSNLVRTVRDSKDINILFVVEEFSNKENPKLKFLIAKYSLSKHIKLCFIDDNITILQKKVKSRTLKEMFLSIKKEERISYIKSEIEKLLDDKISIDYYISLDVKNFKNIVKLFSQEKDLENNLVLNNLCLSENVDRIKVLVSSMKLINYIKKHSKIFDYINFVKQIDNKSISLETNFTSKDIFFICKYFFSDSKEIRYADISTIHKRKRILVDEDSKGKIVEFFNSDEEEKENKIKLKVLNTTPKNRLAVKVVDKLRKNNFDVIEWGGRLSQEYDWTIIVDLANNYKQTKKIKDVLNCGEVIFIPKNSLITEAIVYLGQDCNIYDKLDRYKKQ